MGKVLFSLELLTGITILNMNNKKFQSELQTRS